MRVRVRVRAIVSFSVSVSVRVRVGVGARVSARAPNGRGYTCGDFESRHWCGLYGDCSGDGEGVMELG